MSSTSSKRIEALDYLRGYFIVVIIIDHLERWPSLLSIFTGKGLLWSNASDGFIITAGLLVGYIRGYKARNAPFKDVAKKLLVRSFWLYIWSVLATVLLFCFSSMLPIPDNVPRYDFTAGSLWDLVQEAILLSYIHPWVYFLHLYTIYLLLSIGAIWLLRRNLWWIIIAAIISAITYSSFLSSEWIERLPLFFIPVVIGYYLEPMRLFISNLSSYRLQFIKIVILSLFSATMLLSITFVFLPQIYPESLVQFTQSLFSRNPINGIVIIVAAIWYLALFIIFQKITPFLKKYLAWLLLPFSTGSFSAYTVHSIPLIILMTITPWPDNIIVNSLAGIVALIATMLIIKLPFIKRVIPQ